MQRFQFWRKPDVGKRRSKIVDVDDDVKVGRKSDKHQTGNGIREEHGDVNGTKWGFLALGDILSTSRSE